MQYKFFVCHFQCLGAFRSPFLAPSPFQRALSFHHHLWFLLFSFFPLHSFRFNLNCTLYSALHCAISKMVHVKCRWVHLNALTRQQNLTRDSRFIFFRLENWVQHKHTDALVEHYFISKFIQVSTRLRRTTRHPARLIHIVKGFPRWIDSKLIGSWTLCWSARSMFTWISVSSADLQGSEVSLCWASRNSLRDLIDSRATDQKDGWL